MKHSPPGSGLIGENPKPAPSGIAPASSDAEDAPTITSLGPASHQPANPDVQAATAGSEIEDSARWWPPSPTASEEGKGTG